MAKETRKGKKSASSKASTRTVEDSSKPFDASSKFLVDIGLDDWHAFLQKTTGLGPEDRLSLSESDVSRVQTKQADKVFKLPRTDPEGNPLLLQIEFEANQGDDLARRLLRYKVEVETRHKGTVSSVGILLRKKADSPKLTGELRQLNFRGEVSLIFSYNIIRLWQLKSEDLINGPVGTMPLAFLTEDAKDHLEPLFEKMLERTKDNLELQKNLGSSTYFLMGLCYTKEEINDLFQGRVQMLEESVTYQDAIKTASERSEKRGEARGIEIGKEIGEEIGELRALRSVLELLGKERFKSLPEATRKQIKKIKDPDRLRHLATLCLSAKSWKELLEQD